MQILEPRYKFIDPLCIPFCRNTVFDYVGIQSEFCLYLQIDFEFLN